MSRDFALTGTHQREPEPIRLVAGPLAVDLVNGNLRTISHGGTEVLRAIAYVVRDRDWGTHEPAISNFKLDQGEGRFSLSYDAECFGPDGSRLQFAARIAASAEELLFTVTATPDTDFETNRCGFCILHPIVGLAGSPVEVEHTDGSVVETGLPELIDPWQPFKDMRAITHTVRPGLTAECRMEGDAFEMEDQRNWSDASYKTYVRPLALPWPYVLPAGAPQTQTITLRFAGNSRVAAEGGGKPTLCPGPLESGPPLPRIGVIVYPEDVPGVLANLDRLKQLAPQALLLHFDPTAGHAAPEMAAFAELCRTYRADVTLECAAPCKSDLDVEMGALATLIGDAALVPDSIVVSPSVDRQSTPPGSKWPDCPPLEDVYAAARRALPDVRLGGGMLSYFTELNRKRVPARQLDFITHCTCPIVHAADDLSIMQSLEALVPITGSVRAIYGEKPYRIGPSTIAMRQNPYGSATKPNPDLGRIAMANRDPRHNALFAAAWTVGYAARVAAAGLEQLVVSAFAGPFGLIAGDDEPVAPGGVRPLFHVVRALCELSGLTSLAVDDGRDPRIAAVGARNSDGSIRLLAANLTAHPVDFKYSGLVGGRAQVAILDEDSIRSEDGWRTADMVDAGKLSLPPYSVIKSGWRD